MVAVGGTMAEMSNLINARLRKPAAVEPEVRSVAPRLLFGKVSNRVVSALGRFVIVSARKAWGPINAEIERLMPRSPAFAQVPKTRPPFRQGNEYLAFTGGARSRTCGPSRRILPSMRLECFQSIESLAGGSWV